jgi:hypothetical protein
MKVSDAVITGKQTDPEQARREELDELRARFKSALALRRMTMNQWAKRIGGVTVQQLHAVLSGVRESARLVAKIYAFIEEVHAEFGVSL